MKRRFLFILAFLSILVPCFASTQTMGPNVFAFAGFRIASGQGTPGGLVTGLGLSIPIARKTRLGIGFAFSRLSGTNREEAGISALLGQDSSSPFFVYLRQELFKGKRLSTYASLGAGIQIPGARGPGLDQGPESAAKRPAAPSFVLRAAGGLSLAVMPHVRLFAEGAYLSGKRTGKMPAQTYFLRRILENSFRFDIKAVQLCLGTQFYF